MTRGEAARIVDRQATAWERGDVDAILEDFAPDAVFAAPAGTFAGTEAIRRTVEEFLALGVEVRIEVTRVLADADGAAVEWTWRERHDPAGPWRTAQDAIVFTVHDGLLTSWREYFDPADLDPPENRPSSP